MKFTLVENAQDSLEHAINHMISVDGNRVGQLKRSFLDLAQVIELLLKEKLAREHPAFVLEQIDNYGKTDERTVSMDTAIFRLTKIFGLQLSKDDTKTINQCQRKRNKIQHYEFELNEREACSIIGRSLSFILQFSENELNLDWNSRLINNKRWPALRKLSEFWEAHSKRTLERMESDEINTARCPVCLEDTFDLDLEQCHLCGHIESVIRCCVCRALFIESSDGSEVEMCARCIWEDGYASAHHEKY